jgi:hypothetical protein
MGTCTLQVFAMRSPRNWTSPEGWGLRSERHAAVAMPISVVRPHDHLVAGAARDTRPMAYLLGNGVTAGTWKCGKSG